MQKVPKNPQKQFIELMSNYRKLLFYSAKFIPRCHLCAMFGAPSGSVIPQSSAFASHYTTTTLQLDFFFLELATCCAEASHSPQNITFLCLAHTTGIDILISLSEQSHYLSPSTGAQSKPPPPNVIGGSITQVLTAFLPEVLQDHYATASKIKGRKNF